VTRLTSALALVLALSACSTQTPAPAPDGSPAASSTGPAARYRYQEGTVNLCEKTDLAPIAPVKLTVKTKSPAPPQAGPGEACLFDGTSPSAKPASLRVEAVVVADAAQAQQLYKAQLHTTRMQPDGPIGGLGDEAEGLALETTPGFKYSEYRIHLRRDNLVIEVWLAVGGDEFVPKATLQPMVLSVAAATLSTVDTAWGN
jgi:hypothetical protein